VLFFKDKMADLQDQQEVRENTSTNMPNDTINSDLGSKIRDLFGEEIVQAFKSEYLSVSVQSLQKETSSNPLNERSK
jgi:hypothetical protein